MDALTFQSVSKQYPAFSLQDISFSLPKGYIMGYVGRNGAGKTTTIRMAAALCKPDNGQILLYGKTAEANPLAYKDAVGYVSDACYFPATLTPADIAAIHRSFYPTFDDKKFKSYLQSWEISTTKKIKTFSAGMKTKLMLAAVFSRETKLLILDEPTSGLDPLMRDSILDLLQAYIADGKRSVLFSTHIVSDLERVADYITMIDHGRLLFTAPTDRLLEDHLLVQGGADDFAHIPENTCIGIKRGRTGCSALIRRADKAYFPGNCLFEPATCNDIFIYYAMNKEETRPC